MSNSGIALFAEPLPSTANQVKMNLNLQSTGAEIFNELVYLTINKVPKK